MSAAWAVPVEVAFVPFPQNSRGLSNILLQVLQCSVAGCAALYLVRSIILRSQQCLGLPVGLPDYTLEDKALTQMSTSVMVAGEPWKSRRSMSGG
jgi:hypothetical protein